LLKLGSFLWKYKGTFNGSRAHRENIVPIVPAVPMVPAFRRLQIVQRFKDRFGRKLRGGCKGLKRALTVITLEVPLRHLKRDLGR
jgi:hypothetical protein